MLPAAPTHHSILHFLPIRSVTPALPPVRDPSLPARRPKRRCVFRCRESIQCRATSAFDELVSSFERKTGRSPSWRPSTDKPAPQEKPCLPASGFKISDTWLAQVPRDPRADPSGVLLGHSAGPLRDGSRGVVQANGFPSPKRGGVGGGVSPQSSLSPLSRSRANTTTTIHLFSARSIIVLYSRTHLL